MAVTPRRRPHRSIALIATTRFPRLTVASVIALIGLQPPAVAQQVGRLPISVTVPTAPAAIPALGRIHLVYELHVTNFGADTLRIDALELLDQDNVRVDRLAGAGLGLRTTRVGEAQSRTPGAPELAPGRVAVIYLFSSLEPGAKAPTYITHRLLGSDPAAEWRDSITTAEVAVIGSGAALAPPVRGGPWVALRATSPSSGHRLSLVTLNGVTTIPQRFAVDWALLGDDGRMFTGDSATVGAWRSYDQEVVAVADARVVLVRDGAPDKTPFGAPPAGISATDAPGNVVVLQLVDGRYAAYAHLKAGSMRVREGDRVRIGQVIARIGNSGNTLAPHLHCHVSNSVEPLGGEGLPYVIGRYELIGRVSSSAALIGGQPWVAIPTQPARTVENESPLADMVVRFR